MAYQKKQFSPHIYQEWGEFYPDLSSEQMVELFMAITMFPNYEPQIKVPVWGFIKSQIQKDYDEFLETCRRNQMAVIDYWKNKKSQETEEKKTCKRALTDDNKGQDVLTNDNEGKRALTDDNECKPKHITNNGNELHITNNGNKNDNKSSLHSDLINGEQKEKREEFEEFWEKYPKQRAGSKEKGYKAYLKAIKGKKITHERLMKVIEVYAKSKEVQNGYACGCERWFNDEKYNNADFRPIEEDSYVFYGRTYYGEDARRAREIDEDKATYNARC